MARFGRPLYGDAAAVYAGRLGGRICDQPPWALDILAGSVRRVHPRVLPREVVLLLAGGRFAPSHHAILRGRDLEDVERWYSAHDRVHFWRYRRGVGLDVTETDEL